MSPVIAIVKKDMKAFMKSSMFFLLAGLCCLLWGIFFSVDVYKFVTESFPLSQKSQSSGLNINQHLVANYVVLVHYILVFIIAALNMRFFAEEKKMKTFPLLLSSPLTSWQLVLAKTMVGASILLILLMVSAVFPLSLLFYGDLSLSLLFFSYLGTFLILMVYVSASVLASALTDSLIVSVVLSIVFSVSLLLMGVGREFVDHIWLQEIFNYLSMDYHFSFFRQGSLSLSSVLFFSSLIAFFTLLSERVIEFHRWR